VRRFGDTLKRNVSGLVALCRVVPGVVFVAFVACGWTRVSLARFTAASLIVSAFYLPLMLYLVIVFGDALDDHLGLWAWPMLVAFAATNFARKRGFSFRETADPDAASPAVLPSARAASFRSPFAYFPHVIGDGRHTLRQLICTDAREQWKSALHLGIDRTHCGVAGDLDRVSARGEVVRIALIGNQRAGALYQDGRRHITSALSRRIDDIARSMNEFHYGRIDLRFETIEGFMRGEGFSIMEINGIGGEAIDSGIRVWA
jgi:hypothetical protein